MNRHSSLTRVAYLAAVLCAALLASACGGGGGGGGGVIPPGDPIPVFVADDPAPAAMTISMQPGTVTDAMFEVDIVVTDIADFFGAAFHVSYDPAEVDYLGHSTAGSILLGQNPLFFAEEVSGSPGEIAIEASLQGSGAGLANADGLLITLNFEATDFEAGNDFTFTPVSSRLVEECPTVGAPCNEIQAGVTWSGGTLIVN